MPATSRDKSSKVSKASKLSGDAKRSKSPNIEQNDYKNTDGKDGYQTDKKDTKVTTDKVEKQENEDKDEKCNEGSEAADNSQSGNTEDEIIKSPKSKGTKRRSILPFYSKFKSSKNAEKDKSKKEKGEDSKKSTSPSREKNNETSKCDSPTNISICEEKDSLITKRCLGEDDVTKEKDFQESKDLCDLVKDDKVESDVENVYAEEMMDGLNDDTDILNENVLDFKTYTESHSSRPSKYESPLKKTQCYQRSFLHNRFGSNSSDTLPSRLGGLQGFSTGDESPVLSLSALRSRTLEHTKANINPHSKKNSIDAVKARFQNHVNNLTYEGLEFSCGEPSTSSSCSDIYGSRGFTSPISQSPSHNKENVKYTKKDNSREAKTTAKRKFLNRPLKEEENGSDSDTEKQESKSNTKKQESKSNTITTKIDPKSRHVDSITIISNKNMKASLNISIVKSPETSRRSYAEHSPRRPGSFRFSRAGLRGSVRSSQKKKKDTSSKNQSTVQYSGTTLLPLPTAAVTTTEGKVIPEYAKVNKRKNSKPDILEDYPESVRSTSPNVSQIEKAPVLKRIELSEAIRKGRKDNDPSLRVNTVKKTESFKSGSRIGRKSSLSAGSRAKNVKDGLENESTVKTQAVKLRRKDSKNAGNTKAEYRLSVTIKPSIVANLTDKFNTIISQNQPGNPKSEMPLGCVSVQKTKVPRSPRGSTRSPRGSIRSKIKRRTNVESIIKEISEQSNSKTKTEKSNSKPSTTSLGKRENNIKSQGSSLNNSRENLAKRRNLAPKILPDSSTVHTSKKSIGTKYLNSISSKNASAPKRKKSLGKWDNKTDEEKVCLKINSALSSTKFKGETDDSEEDIVDKTDDIDLKEEYNDQEISSSSVKDKSVKSENSNVCLASSEFSISSVTSANDVQGPSNHLMPKMEDTNGNQLRSSFKNSLTKSADHLDLIEEDDQVLPLPERHAKSDSMDSGISTGEDRLSGAGSPHLPGDSLGSLASSCFHSLPEDCSLDTVVSTDTTISADSGITLKASESNNDSLDISELKDDSLITTNENKDEEGIYDIDTTGHLERGIDVEGLEDRCIEGDLRSLASSTMDDTHSEVSSICSDAKSKQSNRGHESRIYSAVKSAVKNTVKKTKERDAERKESDRDKRNRSPSADRDKWYRRGRSRGRSRDREKKKDGNDDENDGEDCKEHDDADKTSEASLKDIKEREGRSYEKWTFKKLREKSQERKKAKQLMKDENLNDDDKQEEYDSKKDDKTKCKDDKEDTTYGKWALRSRSRSRGPKDKKKNKTKNHEEEAKEENTEDAIETDQSEIIEKDSEIDYSQKALPKIPNTEGNIFTFDTESIYDSPLTLLNESPSQCKNIPPPPKTPIPSPPLSASSIPPPPKTPIPAVPTENNNDKNLSDDNYTDASTKQDQETNIYTDSSSTENIYENLYAPNLLKLQRNREKLECRGIKPNSSFLWSADVQSGNENGKEGEKEGLSTFTKLIGIKAFNKNDTYGKISPSSKCSSNKSDEGNYAELQQRADDTITLSYDDIGAVSAISYDDIAAPSSCGYYDIRAPSTIGYDTIRPPSEGYDPINPPKSDSSGNYDDCDGGVVTAKFAVVSEDQMDSISYVYDEISMYNASQSSHSYEPVYPPGEPSGAPAANITSIAEVSETDTPTLNERAARTHHYMTHLDEGESSSADESEDGCHEVFSYKLTRMGGQLETLPSSQSTSTHSTPGSRSNTRNSGGLVVPPLSLVGGGSGTMDSLGVEGLGGGYPSLALTPTEVKSETSDEWMDVSDTETDTSTEPPLTITTQIPLVRMRQRSKRWGRPRNWRRSWSQGVRDVAANGQTSSSRPQSRVAIDHQEYQWQDGGESESEEGQSGHYEAIYEVISPSEDDLHRHINNHYDDDFDSDESDEAYSRLRPQQLDECSDSSRDPQDSFNSEFCSSDKYDLSEDPNQEQQYGITKFANSRMRKLQRNWSLTKKEVRTGLNRIKKKSTFSTSDMKSTENLAAIDASPTSAEKRKWSFKSHFRKKPSLSMPAVQAVVQGGSKKDAATFYLTLTIETDNQDGSEMSDNNSQRTVRSMSESQLSSASLSALRRSTTPSISSVNTQNSCDTPPPTKPRPAMSMYARKTSAGSSTYGPIRPKTAPPAPPKDRESENKENEEAEVSKENIASRLNTLLSSGPTAPSGRRVLRTSDCSSSDSSPVPVLVQLDDGYAGLRPISVKYATIGAMSHRNIGGDSSEDERALCSEITNSVHLNIPNSRNSVSSHGSSEVYIRASDIASAPPPLPLRQKPVVPAKPPMLLHMPSSLMDTDNKDYLEFNCDLNEEEPLYVSSHFQDEPLYQFYTATVLERATQNQGDCSSEDDYEVINDGAHHPISRLQSRPTCMELVTPADGRRTLWCELPEVLESGVLNQLSSQEKKVQEAMFEVLTSEASYLRSLNVLVNHFLQCPEFSSEDGEEAVLTRRERHILFSDIIPVKRCSELFLADLEKRWQESIKISTISDIVLKHAKTNFQVYIKYCSNQIYQDRILKELKAENPRFTEVLSRLESSRVCQSLAMHSFLMLPMQRITRLPLLVDAIFHRLDYATPHWKQTKEALANLTKIVAECNEGARNMERMEQMLLISRQLDFREVKAIPLISASRWLVKKGELTRLTWRETDAKLTFGRRIQKHTLYFFLFIDLLVVTKRKGDDQYCVLDYCPRNMVQVLELDTADKFPGRILDGHKNLLIMTMLQNHENKTVEMVLSCPLESDRTRWVEAVTPRQSENPDERIYEEWDCPQVQAIHQYEAKQPDELSLEVSDVVNVLKKMADGWFQGERIRDGERGWFPGSFTDEVGSAHVRARNLRQRYRLLAISGSFVEELKREKERYDKEEMKKSRRRTITMKEVISSAAIN